MRAAGEAAVERFRARLGQIEIEEEMSHAAADVIFRTLFSIPMLFFMGSASHLPAFNNGTNDIPFIKLVPTAVTRDNIEEAELNNTQSAERLADGDQPMGGIVEREHLRRRIERHYVAISKHLVRRPGPGAEIEDPPVGEPIDRRPVVARPVADVVVPAVLAD